MSIFTMPGIFVFAFPSRYADNEIDSLFSQGKSFRCWVGEKSKVLHLVYYSSKNNKIPNIVDKLYRQKIGRIGPYSSIQPYLFVKRHKKQKKLKKFTIVLVGCRIKS